MTHELKITPKYFGDVDCDLKPFEVRIVDRPFTVGDTLHLREWSNEVYTGRETCKAITYVLRDEDFCKPGYCILGLAPIKVCHFIDYSQLSFGDKEQEKLAQFYTDMSNRGAPLLMSIQIRRMLMKKAPFSILFTRTIEYIE